MIVRDLITNSTATAAEWLALGSISPGIYRPIRLEQVGSVTSIALFFSRNGATKAAATVTPYEGAVLDMSVNPSPVLMLSVMLGVAAAIIDISNTAPSYGTTVAVAFCAPLREKIRAILVTEPTCSRRIGR